jgi:nicotinate-nucleotide adenylyltransferase
MVFRRRAAPLPHHHRAPVLGVFSGSFNPPTNAHLALAHAALGLVDEVLFVLPRAFPHKTYQGVTLDGRLAMVAAATAAEPRFSTAVSDGGLFAEIAEECRLAYGPQLELWFLCGRDAAERIVGWDYGREGAIEEMLAAFGLLVAARGGGYTPPPHLAPRIKPLPVAPEVGDVSATDVRTRIARGRPWRHLVPRPLWETVARLYPASVELPPA